MAKKEDKTTDGIDDIITDKTELEKLLIERRPIKIPERKNIKKLLEPASCYLTGPPLPGDIDDEIEMDCYLIMPDGDDDDDDDDKPADDKPATEDDTAEKDDASGDDKPNREDMEPMCYLMGPPNV
jgi:hypothetical protein